MNPSEEFEWCLHILRFGFRFLQQDISQERGSRFYFIAMSFVFAEICLISTAFDKHFDFNTRCVCLGGLIINLQARFPFASFQIDLPLIDSLDSNYVFQMTIKHCFLQDLNQFNGIFGFLRDVYSKNSKPGDKYYKICSKYGRRSKNSVKFGLGSWTVGYLIVLLLTTLDSLLSDKIRPSVYIYLPGVHHYSTPLMIVLCLFNLLTSSFMLVVTSSCDALFFFLFLNMPMVSSIITDHLQELNDMVLLDRNKSIGMKRKMVEYYCMHLKYKE